MYIPNDDIQCYSFCRLQLGLKRLDTHLNEPTNQNSVNVPKVVKLMNNKTFGTSVINSPIFLNMNKVGFMFVCVSY